MLNTNSNIQNAIYGELQKISAQAGRVLNNIAVTDSLTKDLEFTSLMLARLIVELEAKTGVDPFTEDFSFVDIRTVGDLLNVYTKQEPALLAA